MENFGLILAPRKPKDYIFGGQTKIAGKILQADGQWLDYLPIGEKQHSVYFDTMACVTFSALNVLEILIKRKYGIDVNFSDRFTAKMSGTTKDGNWLYKVGDSIRKDGWVDEIEYPYPREQRTPIFVWEYYYQDISQILKDIGLLNLKDTLVQYEWVDEGDLKKALKESPIQVTVRAWYDTDGNLVYENNIENQNHAVVLVGYKDEDYWLIFDSYDVNGDYIKKLEWNYNFGNNGIKYNITKKEMSNSIILKDEKSNSIVFADPALNEDAFLSYALNRGIEIPLKNGKPDWDKIKLDGTYKLS